MTLAPKVIAVYSSKRHHTRRNGTGSCQQSYSNLEVGCWSQTLSDYPTHLPRVQKAYHPPWDPDALLERREHQVFRLLLRRTLRKDMLVKRKLILRKRQV
jgi:hypothetical protein